jgi:hypothetical protein
VIWNGNWGGQTLPSSSTGHAAVGGLPNATVANVRMFDIVTVHRTLAGLPPSGRQPGSVPQRIGVPATVGVAVSTTSASAATSA